MTAHVRPIPETQRPRYHPLLQLLDPIMKFLALMLLVVLMARECCEGFVGTALPTRAAAAAGTRRHKAAVNMVRDR